MNDPVANARSKSPSGVWVDIFRTGTHTDSAGQQVTVTDDDLDELVASFQELKGDFVPPLRLGGHDGGVAPAAGWVEGLKREGDHLKALFAHVPSVVGQAINKRLYRNVSAGLRFGFKHGEKTYKKVLHHVAILGHQIPAIKGLEGLPALFDENDGDVVTVEFMEEEKMDNTELARENERLKAENEKLKGQLEKREASFSEADAAHTNALEKLQADHAAELKAKDEKLAEFAEAQAQKDVKDVLYGKPFTEGRINPATRDDDMKVGLGLRRMADFSEEGSLWNAWKKGKETGPVVIDFKEKAHAGGEDDTRETKAEADFAEGEALAAKYGRNVVGNE